MGNNGGKESNKDKAPKGDKTKTKKNSSSDEKPYESILADCNTSSLNHPLNDDVSKYYDVTNKILGVGNFSQVKLGVSKETGKRCALKYVDKSLVKNKPELLKNEVDILFKVKHKNVIGLLDLFDTEKSMILVMELVRGGELFDRIVEREQFTEEQSIFVMRQLFEALAYLHEIGIVHRDLKPENLLLENEVDDIIKIADFGLSKIYTEEMMMSTSCGTPGYVAPEILTCEGYSNKVDMWSSGVIMYILLSGYPPFYNENEAKLFNSILNGHYEFHSPYWDDISEDAKDLIKSLLVLDANDRLSAKEALKHPWFGGSKKRSKTNHKNYKQQLKHHNSTKKVTSKFTIT